ncbi:MAG TPA: AMP-binding protein [Pseudonocardiaceae bacterium]|nr:AMP-binding protein [Pseudonocardiaceae bacterium]
MSARPQPPEDFPLAEIPALFAAAQPDQVAVRCADVELTWAQLHLASNRVAHGLLARGVTPGRLVSLLLPNSVDMIVAVFACYKAGATPQPLSARLTDTERDEILALADPAVVITEEHSVAQLADEGGTDADLPTVIAPSWKAPTSGGSTGRPKVILAGSPAVIRQAGADRWGIESGERMLITAPLHHNAPFGTALYCLFTGGTVTLMTRFDPELTLALTEQHSITWLYVVPTMMRRIHALPDDTKAGYDLSSLRSAWHVAAPCPPWLKRAWIDWLGAERIWELYAGTEAEAGCTINGVEWLAHPGSVGRTVWGEIKIVDADGVDVTEPRVAGEVYMRVAPGSPPAYRYIGATAKELHGWSSLGDMGEFDEDGYLYLHDRLTDMILVGGVNVFPAEVENALMAHPAVLSGAVIGLPDGDLGNRVHAIVETPAGSDVSADEVAEFVVARLSPHKRPKTIEIVHIPLRDETGKMRRSALRAARM